MDVSLTRSGPKGSSRSENYSGCCLPLKFMQNKILALKYRPQEFKDLIGQEVIAKTITNAIEIDKTPNAYLLTGIRGVGKTTTARLIAKKLNCLKNSENKSDCNLKKKCSSCEEISNSNNIDVLEMDAASKTGIDDVREIIESAKYSPVNSRYKIFIIDEIHMLSKQAFNGLLKTLEEPPPRLKFILATTEVRKIPITILSRCQRFDLKRVDSNLLKSYLKTILEREKGKISEKGLDLITRASEGSVRDGISLLDRALIIQSVNNGKEVTDFQVREMLGVADRSKMMDLFKYVIEGNNNQALILLKEFINEGLDAKNFLNDMLEIIYLLTRSANLGQIKNDKLISENDIEYINNFSRNINVQDLSLFWQLTLKTLDDLKIINNDTLALEMYIIQLTHLQSIEEDEISSKKTLNDGSFKENLIQKNQKPNEQMLESNKNNNIQNQLKNTDQLKEKLLNSPQEDLTKNQHFLKIESINDIIKVATENKEYELKYDLERNVKLVSFAKGKINISFSDKLNKNFIKSLTEKLKLWTGERWIISLSQESGAKTVFEANKDAKEAEKTDFQNSKITKEILKNFSDADLEEVIDD